MSNITGRSSDVIARDTVEQSATQVGAGSGSNFSWTKSLALVALGALFPGESKAQSGPDTRQDAAIASAKAEPKNSGAKEANGAVVAPAKPVGLEPLPALKGVAPTLAVIHQGYTISCPEGGEAWIQLIKDVVTVTNAELAKFGIKSVRDGRIIVVGNQEEYDRLTTVANRGGSNLWRTVGDKDGVNRIVLMRAPIGPEALVPLVAEGVAGINCYAAQGGGSGPQGSEAMLQASFVQGVIQQVLLTQAAKVEGVPRNETTAYRSLIDNALTVPSRPSAESMLTYKEGLNGNKSAPLPRAISRSFLEVMMPDESTKAGAAQAKEFRALVTGCLAKPGITEELSKADTALIAQSIVKVLKLDEWFKKASKDRAIKEQLRELGIDVDSKEFKDRLKESSKKKEPSDRDFAIIECFYALRLKQAGEHVDGLRLRGLALVDTAGANDKNAKDKSKDQHSK